MRGLGLKATLAMNELAARLTSEGHELFRLGFGQSPFPAPDEVVAALRDNAPATLPQPTCGRASPL